MINESKILKLVQRQKETGLTITAFCANEGIPKSSYYYWRKKLTKEPGNRFIELRVNSALMNESSKLSHELQGQFITGDDFPMEITYSNGTTLRIKRNLDLEGLRSLVLLTD
jgi:hypothetical protein